MGFEPTVRQSAFETTNLPMKLNTQKQGWTWVRVMHYRDAQNGKRSQATGQTFLVLRILNLQPRNPSQSARISLYQNKGQETGGGNLSDLAQGRA